jgi:DNA-binding response OmpR family regulator
MSTAALVDSASMDTLLVIEDSAPMQRAIQRVFEAEAFTVELASDGLAGLEAFRAHAPSAVVLDLKLPGMPGRELCREFKAIAPGVPVIVVSANAEVDDKVLLLELGADDYVTKPFSPKELVARVRRAMRHAVQASRVAGPLPQSESPLCRFADVTVNVNSMEVTRGGRIVSLTAQEFRLLRYFIDRANRAR